MTFVRSEVAGLRRVLLKHARDAFVSTDRIAEQWQALDYTGPPDVDAAARESDALAALLESLGVAVEWMASDDVGMDSIYVRDASVMTGEGVVMCRMGKRARRPEPDEQRRFFAGSGVPVLGEIRAPGIMEGGDVAWLDERTLAVGRGYRTNDAGVEQLSSMLPPGVDVVRVPLPHYRGPSDVFHLMSIISPLSADLLLVYSPLMPVPFRELLLERGFDLVEVPEEEFDSMGCNVLAVAPRVAVAADGNPETKRRMEAHGVEVHLYAGAEISAKGCGGPTCLTRPLERS